MPFEAPFPLIPVEELQRNSPSRRDGIDWKKELQLRRTFCKFIETVAQRELKLPKNAVLRAQLLCHRFYARVSLDKCDRWIMGAAAIMLAGKLENCYRPARDVVMATWVVKSVSKPEQRQWLSDQTIVARDVNGRGLTFVGYLTDKLFDAERALLNALGFWLDDMLPSSWLLSTFMTHLYSAAELREANCHKAKAPPNVPDTPAHRAQRGKCRQAALNLSFASHRLVECLEYSGADIGKAALFIATRHWRVPLHLPEGISFTEHFDISQARLDEIVAALSKEVTLLPWPQEEDAYGAAGSQAPGPQPAADGGAAPTGDAPAPAAVGTKRPREEGEGSSLPNGSNATPASSSNAAAANGTAPLAAAAESAGVKRTRLEGAACQAAAATAACAGTAPMCSTAGPGTPSPTVSPPPPKDASPLGSAASKQSASTAVAAPPACSAGLHAVAVKTEADGPLRVAVKSEPGSIMPPAVRAEAGGLRTEVKAEVGGAVPVA